MTNYEVIPYQPEHKDEVVALRTHSYEGEFPECRPYLEWKYERNPYLREPIFYLALSGGEVVAMRGFYGTRWEGPGGETMIPCADDFSIKEAHRNTGVATRLMRAALDDLARRNFPWVMNASGGRITVLSSLAMGWKSAGAMEPVGRFGTVSTLANRVRGRLRGTRFLWRLDRSRDIDLRSPFAPFRRLDDVGPVRSRDGSGTLAVESAPRVAEMAALAARLSTGGRLRHARGPEFFAWRFQHPVRDYRFVTFSREGRLEGYLVVARYPAYRAPMLPFHIVDWEASAPEIAAELLEKTLQWGRFPEIGTWTGTLPVARRETLARAGFIPTGLELRPRGMPCILVRPLAMLPAEAEWRIGGLNALDPANWSVRLVDSMHG